MAGNTALGAIQKAFFTILDGDVTLKAKARTYDDTPQDTAFPYITLGEAVELPFNTFNRNGKDVLMTLHIWSNERGFKEATDILGMMNALLDYVTFSVTGFTNLVYSRFESSQTLRDPNGVTRHVVANYRVVVQD